MTHLLDSDVVINFLRRRPDTVRLLREVIDDGPLMSVISYGEVVEGIRYGTGGPEQAARFASVLSQTRLIDVDRQIAERWATLRRNLRRRGQPLKDADLLIAATALQHDLTLVTGNTGHFERIDGLRLL